MRSESRNRFKNKTMNRRQTDEEGGLRVWSRDIIGSRNKKGTAFEGFGRESNKVWFILHFRFTEKKKRVFFLISIY